MQIRGELNNKQERRLAPCISKFHAFTIIKQTIATLSNREPVSFLVPYFYRSVLRYNEHCDANINDKMLYRQEGDN